MNQPLLHLLDMNVGCWAAIFGAKKSLDVALHNLPEVHISSSYYLFVGLT